MALYQMYLMKDYFCWLFFFWWKKNRLGRFIHLQAVNIWKVDGLFFLLKEKNWRKKKYNDLVERKGNSKSWKLQIQSSQLSALGNASLLPQKHIPAFTFFSVNKRKKLEMLNFLTALVHRVEKGGLSFSLANL